MKRNTHDSGANEAGSTRAHHPRRGHDAQEQSSDDAATGARGR